MRGLLLGPTIAISIFGFRSAIAQTQLPDTGNQEAVRVTVTINADGSRTSYQFDSAHKKATATTTAPDGKVREKINYDLDENGRFSSGVVTTPSGQFRFRSTYRYDASGRLQEETHLDKDNNLINKLVYHYDPAGKQIGYSVFDAAGRLVGKTISASPTPTPRGKPR